MIRRVHHRGINLPMVMALGLILFIFSVALHNNLRQSRYRLSSHKHQEAAHWLAVSGADLAEARLRAGRLRAGENLESPQFQQGRFVVQSKKSGSQVTLTSTGFAADKKHVTVRKLTLP